MRTKAAADPSFKLASMFTETNRSWMTDDAFLAPVVENDPLLYDIEFEEFEEEVVSEMLEKMTVEEATKTATAHLLEELKKVKNEFKEYQAFVMKTYMPDVTESQGPPPDEGDYYFGSYADSEIHEIMLKDIARTEAYRDWMYMNKTMMAGKVVLDVGCGTGILSMFAAKAGAKHVYAIDNSSIIEKAQLNAKENNLDSKITFIRGRVEDVSLPVDKVDIIISEWMGYFLLFEGMLDSVLFARNKWLQTGGYMGPDVAKVLLTAISDDDLHIDRIGYWDDVYGFKMTTMKSFFYHQPQIFIVNTKAVVANTAELKHIDISSTTTADLDFETPFKLTMTKDASVHALCGWFDCTFPSIDHPILLSTSLMAEPTHWKQTVFFLETPVKLLKGQYIEGVFSCVKHAKNHRELDIKITFTTHSEDGAQLQSSVQDFHLC
ncbi:Protein arginine N-methyltransferase 3 [Blyttiomyces sp. JEL0837]|nr:Protein arginine N-methyltransferase 3 [Blyttiomyces sp. JEL0837]